MVTGPPVVTDHGIDIPVVTRPDIPIPDYTPDIPSNEHPSPGGGPGPGPGGDTPIVPEPGSLLLLGIAGAIGGVVVVRRRRLKLKADARA